jgi:hypothetical protein
MLNSLESFQPMENNIQFVPALVERRQHVTETLISAIMLHIP